MAWGGLALAAAGTHAQSDPFAAPPSYYAGVTGTGTTLENSLAAAMTAGHVQRSYGDFRQSAAIHDADPTTPGNILLVYNNASVSSTWDSGSTWNREHVWPQSLQPGSASNSSRGNLGDPHALRPCNPSINSSRGNKPYGFASTTGSHGSLGSYYFAGDIDKGDIARSLFYSATRYASTGLELVSGFPSSNQMGGLDDLVAWHYLDIPDAFERRRNHAIFSSSLNPTYATNNRNAFVDLPGAVWSVFVDQFNDSRVYVGAAPAANGSSVFEIDLGQSIAGTIVPPQPFTIQRQGNDGTYYAVIPVDSAITNAPLTNGFTGAFAINDASSHTYAITMPTTDMMTPGMKAAELIIDNLDMTLQGGAGRGGNDADDIVRLLLDVRTPGTASFDAGSTVSVADIDLGTVSAGSIVTLPVSLHVLGAPATTAAMVFDIASATGDAAAIGLDLPPTLVQPGLPQELSVEINGQPTGPLSATYTISVQDDPSVLGASVRPSITLNIDAMIAAACSGDIADGFGFPSPDGLVDFGDFLFALSVLGPCPGGTPGCTGDIADDFGATSPDGQVSFGDFLALLTLLGPCP